MSWFARLMYGTLVWKERRRAERARSSPGSRAPMLKGRHLEIGAHGETLTYWYLRRTGYIVVARNRRSRRGELDIVAWDGPVLVFVEVKTRSGNEAGPPERAVRRDQQRRIAQSARDYMKRLKQRPAAYRFDIASVSWDCEAGYQVRMIKDAFKG